MLCDLLAVISADFEPLNSICRGIKSNVASDKWKKRTGSVSFNNTLDII